MRTKLTIALVTFTALITFAQSTLPPVAVDWRYKAFWDDPNPPGAVARWLVYATNATSGSRSVGSTTTNAPLQTLLSGLPAGTYTIYTTAVSALGDEGDPGSSCLVIWPGGNGKLKGGGNPHVGK